MATGEPATALLIRITFQVWAVCFLVLCTQTLCALTATAQGIDRTPTLLSADKAFVVRATLEPGQSAPTLWVDFNIAPGHYLYRDKIELVAKGGSYSLGNYALPAGTSIEDEFFGQTSVYYSTWGLRIPLNLSGFLRDVQEIEIALQGCSIEPAVCYAPERRSVEIVSLGTAAPVSDMSGGSTRSLYENPAMLSDYLRRQPGWLILPLFWFFGLLLSLTPCILPMVPIVGGLLSSQNHSSRPGLAWVYVLGMSLAYSAAGVAAALLGHSLQSFLQRPSVLLAMAALLAVLAMSMFDGFILQAPSAWREWVAKWQRRLSGGKYWHVFLLGVLSAWIISPCVTPPLVGALLYIAHSGDAYLGGASLMALGLGMGVPLLLMGYAGHWLPSSGKWMEYLKRIFGVLILVSAAFLASRALPALNLNILWDAGKPTTGAATLRFEPAQDLQTLRRAVASHEGLILHKLYADWCSSCLEMERTTFADARVHQALRASGVRLLVSDVTANTPEQRALMRAYGLFGPPALLLFLNGRELEHARMVGYVDADRILDVLRDYAPVR
jgi:thiol:disulfide interchange protein DsbD